MNVAEIAPVAFGCLGIGGGVVALYIRATIADTIMNQLDKRYVATGICVERHTSITAQLARLERQSEEIENKVDRGFDSLRAQLSLTQISRDRIEHD